MNELDKIGEEFLRNFYEEERIKKIAATKIQADKEKEIQKNKDKKKKKKKKIKTDTYRNMEICRRLITETPDKIKRIMKKIGKRVTNTPGVHYTRAIHQGHLAGSDEIPIIKSSFLMIYGFFGLLGDIILGNGK